jgi:SPP1 gp7 family putative phage head morphogenesis protein
MQVGDYFKDKLRGAIHWAMGKELTIPGEFKAPMAWSSDMWLQNSKFPTYNPDLLIGVKGYGVYKQMMTDEQVKAVVRFRREAVTSRDWTFEIPEDAKLSDKEKLFRINLFKYIVTQMSGSWKSRLDIIMSSLYQGFSMTEKVYTHIEYEGKQWVGIESLRKKPYHTFYFYVDEFGALHKIEQRVGAEILEFTPEKFIHHVHNVDFDENYGQSELREAYRAWWSKDITIKFHNIYIERMAGGFIWADTSENKGLTRTSPDFLALQDIFQNINAQTGIIAPPGVKINVEFPGSTDAFEKAVAMHDKSIAKSLLTPNLLGISEQGQVGSYSQSQTQLEAFLWILDAEAKALEETLNEQLFKELADFNFGDGVYPCFRFKPLSDSQKNLIIGQWKDLVSAKAVDTTIEDQKHIREMLSFPELEEDVALPTPSSSALTGVQISALMDVLDKVRNKDIEPETAVMVIVESFPINEERAQEIVGSVKIKSDDEIAQDKAAEAGAEIDPATGKPKQPAPGEPGKTGKEGDKNKGKGQPEEDMEHEITGRTRVSISAFNRAKARVDFAVIDRQAVSIVNDFVPRVSTVLNDWLKDVVKEMESTKMGTAENSDPTPIKNLKVDNRIKQRLDTTFKSALRAGWSLGVKHATNELDKAKGAVFSKTNIDFGRLDDNAAAFFDAKTFSMSGKLSQDALSIIQNILFNGIKASKSTQQLVDEIYQTFASKGMISYEDAKEALGEALAVENPDARLRTVINTNTFEAIGEARYSFFTDPVLNDFVQALEYSAILDDRTTEICEQLDGHIHAVDGDVWDAGYRPPNHYNCRSILIPVTANDTWEESPYPTVEPQEGF